MTAMSIQIKPAERLLRTERLPHIWCPGCGIGSTLNCFVRAVDNMKFDLNKLIVVSGIGCTGRVAGYLKLDSFHTTHGRALPFATGLKLANPELKLVVFSGDGDLTAIGGNHLIHAARRNIDMTVICVNNFIYGMTGGQVGPTSPTNVRTATTPYGNYEPPFNLPYLLAASGASYIARWTIIHLTQLEAAIGEAMTRPGFNFIEVISPCPTLYGRLNKKANGVDFLRYYQQSSVIRNGADPKEADIEFNGPIIVGKFIDKKRSTLNEGINKIIAKAEEQKKK